MDATDVVDLVAEIGIEELGGGGATLPVDLQEKLFHGVVVLAQPHDVSDTEVHLARMTTGQIRIGLSSAVSRTPAKMERSCRRADQFIHQTRL
jgi:hypothetical protein